MNTSVKKRLMYLTITALLIFVGFITFDRLAYEKIEIELGNDPCMALDPGCGFCPAERVGNKCYKKEFRFSR